MVGPHGRPLIAITAARATLARNARMPSEDIGTDETVLAIPTTAATAPTAPAIAIVPTPPRLPAEPHMVERPAMMFATPPLPAASMRIAPAPRAGARRPRPWWIFALLGTIVVGLAVAIVGATYAMRASARISEERSVDPPPPPIVPPPPRPAPPPAAHSPEQLAELELAALVRADTTALAALLAPDAFAIGRDADQLATGPANVADAVSSSLGAGRDRLASRSLHIGRDGDVAWIASELDAATLHLASTQLAQRDPVSGTWRVVVWHLAERVPNRRAYAAARDGVLPDPSPIRDRGDDQLRTAFRAAFASRTDLIAAFSEREDAIDFGSAPGERVLGGPAIKRAFTKMTGEPAIHDGIAAGRATANTGWAAANVDYVLRDGTSQTYRVLAIFVDDRIVLAHWSNGGPL